MSPVKALEEIGSEDDIFSTYIGIGNLGGTVNGWGRTGNGSDQGGHGKTTTNLFCLIFNFN